MLGKSLQRLFSFSSKPPNYILPTANKGPQKIASSAILDKLHEIHFEYRPLIVFGTLGSGKSAFINYMRYTYDKFTYISPYTTSKHFYHGESVGNDYHQA